MTGEVNTLHLTQIISFRIITMAGGERRMMPRNTVITYTPHQKESHNLSVVAKYLGVHLRHVPGSGAT